MLLPHQLDELSNEILEPVHEAESELLTALAAFLFAAFEYGAYSNELQAVRNAFDQDVIDIKQRHLRTIERRTSDIITRASNQSIRAENFRGHTVIFAQITNRHVTAMRGKIVGMFQNLGFNRLPFLQAVDSTLDTLEMWRTSAYPPRDSKSVLEDVFREIGETGIQHFGEGFAMDAFIRRELLYETKQSAQEAAYTIADIVGFDGMETTAHHGARESHKPWQGLQFSRQRGVSGYEWFGERAESGLQEKNCRHMVFPIRLGQRARMSRRELANLDKDFTFNGRTWTTQQAQARLRTIERSVRKNTREMITNEIIGNSERVAALAIQSRKWRDEYVQLAERSGLPAQNARLWFRE